MTDWVLTTNPGVSTELLMAVKPDGTLGIAGDDNPISTAITGKSGSSVMVGSFGEMVIGSKNDDVSVQFQYDYLNTDHDVKPAVLTGDGAASVSDSLLQVSSVATGTAYVESRNSIRYRPGHAGYVDFTALFDGTGVGQVGGIDSVDGFFIECNNGVLTFCYRRNGTDLKQTVDTTGIDLSKLNIYRILFGYLGIASPVLMVKQGDYRTIATIETEGKLTTTHVANPVFPMRAYAANGMTVKCGSWAGGVINGGKEPVNRSFVFPNTPIVNGTTLEEGVMTLTSTNVGTVAIFKVRDTYQGQANKVRSRLLYFSATVIPPATGSGEVIYQIIGNPTLTGTPTYTDINTNNSVMEVDHTPATGASVSYSSGGKVIINGYLRYAAGQGSSAPSSVLSEIGSDALGATGIPGDVFAIVAKDRGGNGASIRLNLAWEDLF